MSAGLSPTTWKTHFGSNERQVESLFAGPEKEAWARRIFASAQGVPSFQASRKAVPEAPWIVAGTVVFQPFFLVKLSPFPVQYEFGNGVNGAPGTTVLAGPTLVDNTLFRWCNVHVSLADDTAAALSNFALTANVGRSQLNGVGLSGASYRSESRTLAALQGWTGTNATTVRDLIASFNVGVIGYRGEQIFITVERGTNTRANLTIIAVGFPWIDGT